MMQRRKPSDEELEKRIQRLAKRYVTQKAEKKVLEESVKKYSALVENARDGVTIIHDGLRKYSNQAMVDMFGYDQREIVDQPFEDIIAPHCRGRVRSMLDQALETNRMSSPTESQIIAKDGRLMDVEVSASPISYGGKPALMVIIRDLDKQQKMAQCLYESEERYRVLNDYLNLYIPLHLGYSDEHYKFQLWNKYSETMLGYTKQEVIGKLSPSDIHENHEEAMEVVRAAEEDGIYDKEIRMRRKNGSLVPVHLVAVPKKNQAGKVVGLYGFAEDITARMQAETALRESEKRFRDLVENALMGILICQKGRVVYENPEQERIFGFSGHGAALEDFERLVHPADRTKFTVIYDLLNRSKPSVMDTNLRFYPDGRLGDHANIKWVQFRASRIEYQGDDALLINMMDTTRTRQLENLLNMEDKMKSLGRVAAGMAHEIRSPLSGINILLANLKQICLAQETLGGENLNEMRQIVDKTMEASQKIESVMRRILDFTRPNEVNRRPIHVNQPIKEAIKLSSVTLRKENIRLETDLIRETVYCYADARLIEQVLLNLITNAIQAMSEKPGLKCLGIRSAVENRHAVIRIADSGPGVQMALVDKIFDPYFSTKSKGSGIGLSLSRRIIKDHEGDLDVSSSKWSGAEFTIRIPLMMTACNPLKNGKESK